MRERQVGNLPHHVAVAALPAHEHPGRLVGKRALVLTALIVLQALQQIPPLLPDGLDDLFQQSSAVRLPRSSRVRLIFMPYLVWNAPLVMPPDGK